MELELASLGRALLFLGVPFVIMIFYLQYRWAHVCENNVQLLVAQKTGGGKFILAPKEGGEVTIHNPDTGDTRTWPINELATIEVPYPGVGFVPKPLQKSIRMAIVSEGDWEPLLNRSPHRKNVASPDVVAVFRELATKIKDKDLQDAIEEYAGKLSTGPTREMIADPALLGSIMRNGVMKALASVSNDLLEQLANINKKLADLGNFKPIIMYALMGFNVILSIFLIYNIMQIAPSLQDYSEVVTKIDKIMAALGVKP